MIADRLTNTHEDWRLSNKFWDIPYDSQIYLSENGYPGLRALITEWWLNTTAVWTADSHSTDSLRGET